MLIYFLYYLSLSVDDEQEIYEAYKRENISIKKQNC